MQRYLGQKKYSKHKTTQKCDFITLLRKSLNLLTRQLGRTQVAQTIPMKTNCSSVFITLRSTE
jgi:hypothetical protein